MTDRDILEKYTTGSFHYIYVRDDEKQFFKKCFESLPAEYNLSIRTDVDKYNYFTLDWDARHIYRIYGCTYEEIDYCRDSEYFKIIFFEKNDFVKDDKTNGVKEVTNNNNNNNKIETKKEKKTMENATIKTNETLNKGLQTLKSTIEGLIVDDKNIGLTPSGLAINDRVYSKKEDAILRVGGTQLLSIPAGFNLPVETKDIELGDIVFNNGEPLFVLRIEESKKNHKVIAIDSTEREVILYPALGLQGKQVYNKLITPFKYDGGCNPVLNIGTLTALSYLDGGIDNAIEKLTPEVLSLIPKLNLGEYLKDKRVAFLAPIIVIGYKMFKENSIDLSNLDSLKTNLKEKLSKLDKKTLSLIILAILLLIYVAKDKISEKLLEEKIRNIKFIGKFAEPTAKFLIKIPSIKKRIKL